MNLEIMKDKKDLIYYLNENFSKNGFRSLYYDLEKTETFKGNDIVCNNDNINHIAYYGYYLVNKTSEIKNEIIYSQLNKAKQQGLLAQYITVVLNELLRNFAEYECKMIQGYCSYKVNQEKFTYQHSFTVYDNDKVLDTVLFSLEPNYLTDRSHIQGLVPNDVLLEGWTESIETENKYREAFANWDNLLIAEFKLLHLNYFYELIKNN